MHQCHGLGYPFAVAAGATGDYFDDLMLASDVMPATETAAIAIHP